MFSNPGRDASYAALGVFDDIRKTLEKAGKRVEELKDEAQKSLQERLVKKGSYQYIPSTKDERAENVNFAGYRGVFFQTDPRLSNFYARKEMELLNAHALALSKKSQY